MNTGTRNTAVVLILLFLVGIAGVIAQSSESEASEIVGTWRTQVTLRNCETGDAIVSFPGMLTFAQGGTLLEATTRFNPAVRGSGHGFWEHTGGNTYHAVIEAFTYDADGAWGGTQRLVMLNEVEGDEGRTVEGTAEIFDSEGGLVMGGCSTSVWERMD